MDFFGKCDQIRRKLRIWLYLLKKSLIKKLHFLCSLFITISSSFLYKKMIQAYTRYILASMVHLEDDLCFKIIESLLAQRNESIR